jgi:hypothetical protein
MKVLVTGSRRWTDKRAVHLALKQLPPDTVVIHGACATGADAFADAVAKKLGFQIRAYPANWDQDGKKAGPIRNSEMLRKEHVQGDPIQRVIAFTPDLERSRGTRDMVLKAKAKGIKVEVITS